jgi:hypothetical protein
MAATLPVRPCIGCGQSDDHPRHEVVVGDGNHTSVYWHMDCHVNSEASCDLCKQQLADAAGAQGGALRTHLVALTPTVTES